MYNTGNFSYQGTDQNFGQTMIVNNNGNQMNNVKTNIGTEEIKEIVYVLNNHPFNESFTMVMFDELSK